MNGIFIRCKRCRHAWTYHGKKRSSHKFFAYTSCPHCRANIKIPKNKVVGDGEERGPERSTLSVPASPLLSENSENSGLPSQPKNEETGENYEP